MLGNDHPDTTISYNSMAKVYVRQGNCHKALAYLFKAYQISNQAKIRKEQMKGILAQKLLQKHEGIDGLIVALLLIVIAVGVGIFFRNTIMDVLSGALNTVQAKITALFSGTTGGVS